MMDEQRVVVDDPFEDQTEHGLLAGIRALLECVAIVAIVAAVMWLLVTYVVQPYSIPSESMEDTLLVGDCVLAEKVSSSASDPQAGDIITFTMWWEVDENGERAYVEEEVEDEDEPVKVYSPVWASEEQAEATYGGTIEQTTFVKRVIAVAGDEVDLIDGHVYVNGEAISEGAYVTGHTYDYEAEGIEYPFIVPEGEIWVMGDNRESSGDSREFGSVPVENVTGHVVYRYWPIKRIGAVTASRGN